MIQEPTLETKIERTIKKIVKYTKYAKNEKCKQSRGIDLSYRCKFRIDSNKDILIRNCAFAQKRFNHYSKIGKEELIYILKDRNTLYYLGCIELITQLTRSETTNRKKKTWQSI
jgi:hypothetical protein